MCTNENRTLEALECVVENVFARARLAILCSCAVRKWNVQHGPLYWNGSASSQYLAKLLLLGEYGRLDGCYFDEKVSTRTRLDGCCQLG